MPIRPPRAALALLSSIALASSSSCGGSEDSLAPARSASPPAAGLPVTLSLTSSEVNAAGAVAVAVRASGDAPVAGVQAAISYDDEALDFLGLQLAGYPTAFVAAHAVDGTVRVVAVAPRTGLSADAVVLLFRAKVAGGALSVQLEDAWAEAVIVPAVPRPVRVVRGRPVRDARLVAGAAETLTPGAWASRLGWSRPGSRLSKAIYLPTGQLYGDTNGDGLISVLDVAFTSDAAVGILVPTVRQFDVANVAPANMADGVEAALPDPCRPGRACTTAAPYAETGPGFLSVLDVVAISDEAVGLTQPVVGLPILSPTATVSGVVSSPQRGALAGVTVSVTSGGASTATTGAGGAFTLTALAGSVTLRLSGIPADCADPGPRTLSAAADASVTSDISVACGTGLPLANIAFVADVNVGSGTVAISSPASASLSARGLSARIGAVPSFSLLAGDVLSLSSSNFFASAPSAGKVRVQFDLAVTNKLFANALTTPTFPDAPPGQVGVLMIPYFYSVILADGNGTPVEVPSGSLIAASVDWNGDASPDLVRYPALPGTGGAQYNFFNDVGCQASGSTGVTSDCFRYETFPPLAANSTSAVRRVGFDIDQSVGQFRVRIIAAADVAPGPVPLLGSVSGALASPRSAAAATR